MRAEPDSISPVQQDLGAVEDGLAGTNNKGAAVQEDDDGQEEVRLAWAGMQPGWALIGPDPSRLRSDWLEF